MCLPGLFQSQGHSAAATHSEYINIGVQLITSIEKETARNRNDGVVGSKVRKRGNHEGAIFRLLRGTDGNGQSICEERRARDSRPGVERQPGADHE
jgi:hypothetical protein